MYKTTIFFILLVSLFFTCSQPKKEELPRQERKPNIVFFIADDMYPEMFNCIPQGEGKNLTPNIDRLASEGTLLVNQYVASPVCTPSRFNCLTGRYASRATNKSFLTNTKKNGGQTVIQWNTFITQRDKTLPHYLSDLGYTTGMVGKSHVVEVEGLYKFPDYWADPTKLTIREKVAMNYQKTVEAVMSNGFDYAGAIYHDNPGFVGLGALAYQNMDWIAEAGVDFIEKNKDHPFFLYFATTLPHHPTDPKHSWQADPKISAKGILKKAPEVLPARHTLPERLEKAGLGGKNKENILWMDDALGALLAKLEENNLIDNTIIFFFNDHGQKAKGTLYQGGILNPSIVWRSKGFKVGRKTPAYVQNIDFAPTILEMVGGKVEEGQFDGKSFKSQLEEEIDQGLRPMFFELGYARAIVKGGYKLYAIRYPEFAKNWSKEDRLAKLAAYNGPRMIKRMRIVNENDAMAPFSHFSIIPGGGAAEHESYGKLAAYFEEDQLYNLIADPYETNNVISNEHYKEIYDDLKAELKAHLSKMPGKFDL